MSFVFYIFKSGLYRDISRYIVGDPEVPFNDRNRDYTLRASSMMLHIDDNCPYTPAPLDKIKVTYSGSVVYTGKVKKAKHIRYSDFYETEVLNRLSDLQKYLVDINTLLEDLLLNGRDSSTDKIVSSYDFGFDVNRAYWADIVDTTTINVYNARDLTAPYLEGQIITSTAHGFISSDQVYIFTSGGLNYIAKMDLDKITYGDNESVAGTANTANVKCEYLIQRMFSIAGLSLTSNLAGATIGTFYKSAANRDYTGDDFRQDLSALFGMNQGTVRNFLAGPWTEESKITFFDYISAHYKAMSAILKPTDSDAFTNYHGSDIGEEFTVLDNNLADYKDTEVAAEYQNFAFELYYGGDSAPGNYRQDYYAFGPDQEMYKALSNAGDGKLNWFSNHALLFADLDGPAGDVEANDFWDPRSLGVSGDNTRFTRHLISDYVDEEIETDIIASNKATIQNYLNVKSDRSKIIQENYT